LKQDFEARTGIRCLIDKDEKSRSM